MALTQVSQAMGGTGTSSVAASLTNTFGFKNRIINGDMRIAQRGTSAVNPPAGWGYSTIDRLGSWAGDASNWTIQQSSSAPTGFNNSALITTTSALSIANGTYDTIAQNIEGVNCADLMWGTANAKACTFSFWVNCSVTGTFSGYFYNNGYSYNYPFTYSIPTANTWTYITITVPGPTTGTWLSGNALGIQVGLTLASGSLYQGTANTWQSGSYKVSVAGTVNVLTTNGATFYTTGWQFEVGSQATNFDYRDYGRELIMCQRYYYSFNLPSDTNLCYPATVYNNTAVLLQTLPVTNNFRTTPTVTSTIGTASPTFRQYDGTNPQSPTITGINLGLRNTNAPFIWGELQYSVSSGSWGSAGYIGTIAWSSGTNSKLKFDAEL